MQRFYYSILMHIHLKFYRKKIFMLPLDSKENSMEKFISNCQSQSHNGK